MILFEMEGILEEDFRLETLLEKTAAVDAVEELMGRGKSGNIAWEPPADEHYTYQHWATANEL